MNSFGGNWIDLLIIGVFFLYLLSGIKRGFILGVLDLAGFLFSFLSALKLYPILGVILTHNFSISRGIANALGFLLFGVMMESIYTFLVRLVARPLYKFVFPKENQSKEYFLLTDQILGVIPLFGEALIFTAFILTLVVSLPVAQSIKRDVTSSRFGSVLVSKTQGIERQLNTIFKDAVFETLTFLTVNPTPSISDTIDLGFRLDKLTIDVASEKTMFDLLNKERVANNIPQLSFDSQLQGLARDYGFDMFERGYFSHYNPEGFSPFDRMDQANIIYTIAGENLALAPDVYLAQQGLMNSAGHRENILSTDFSRVGIGVVDGGIYGQIFVQEFRN